MQHNKILEPDIKSLTINHLMDIGMLNQEESIISEFTVGDFSRRVDLALISPTRLFAYEIKSESDSLSRLEGQVEKYLEYFDKVTVITAPKHTKKTLEMTPNNVAVWEIINNKIKIKRKGTIRKNKSKQKLIDMMTVAELSQVLKKQGIVTTEKKRISIENSSLSAPLSVLREEAIKAIQARYRTRNELFLNEVAYRRSTPEDLKLLRTYNEPVKETENIKHKIDGFLECLNSIQKTSYKKANANKLIEVAC